MGKITFDSMCYIQIDRHTCPSVHATRDLVNGDVKPEKPGPLSQPRQRACMSRKTYQRTPTPTEIAHHPILHSVPRRRTLPGTNEKTNDTAAGLTWLSSLADRRALRMRLTIHFSAASGSMLSLSASIPRSMHCRRQGQQCQCSTAGTWPMLRTAVRHASSHRRGTALCSQRPTSSKERRQQLPLPALCPSRCPTYSTALCPALQLMAHFCA